ncbi:MAG: hypothetical protein KF749_09465 [Bacteroidetes bacterium]|nr:hypothetical protein [Bacteroidota bacterium]MCW5894853.1 hypothetical protein [Bacteroidota bacterium]
MGKLGDTARKIDWTVVVPLVSIALTSYLQWEQMKVSSESAIYQVTSTPKREGYATFMQNLLYAYDNAMSGNGKELQKNIDGLEMAYYGIQPFLVSKNTQDTLYSKIRDFDGYCTEILKLQRASQKREQLRTEFAEYKVFFQRYLFFSLFSVE